MLHTVVFIGRSGCGKGTQAELLKEYIAKHEKNKHEILYVETGARFREFIKGDGYSSQLSREIYDSDARQPDFLASFMWGGFLVEKMKPDMHLVFDGAPRAHSEAVLLTTALEFYKREMPTVIYMDVGRKWAEERLLSRGRQDDVTLEKIRKRLDWFELDVWPAIEYFKTNSFYHFIDINGEQSIEDVHKEIMLKYKKS